MESVFGFVGNGFVIVAADTSAVHSILVHKSNEDKIMVLDSHKLVAASGEPGDRFEVFVNGNLVSSLIVCLLLIMCFFRL